MVLLRIPTIYHIVTAVPDRVQQLAELGRMGLQIIVHTQHIIAGHIMQRRHQGTVLTEISAEINTLYLGIFCAQSLNLGEGAVGGTVVHQNKFIIIAQPQKLFSGQMHRLGDGFFRIITGNDHRDLACLFHFHIVLPAGRTSPPNHMPAAGLVAAYRLHKISFVQDKQNNILHPAEGVP